MQFFARLPIAHKLTVIVMVPTVAALLIASTLFFFFDIAQFRRWLAESVVQSANFANDRLVDPLRWGDRGRAQDVLHMLRQNKQIIAAQLYDAQGAPFARYMRDREHIELPVRPGAPGIIFGSRTLEVVHRMQVFEEAPVGTLYILADSSAILLHAGVYLVAVLLILLMSMLVSYVLSRRLQESVSQPIRNLASIARIVSEEKDYTIRGFRQSEDEIGELVDEFNEMLSQIQNQERQLKEAQDKLEERVLRRTRQLQEETEKHKSTAATLEVEIKERERAELAAHEARAAAEAASRSKGDFLANMSHEIRTPMNGIIGMTELLMGTPLNATQTKYAEAVRRSGRSLLKIIGDILDFSKVEAGLLEIEPIPFDLQVACEDVVELLSTRADEKGLTLILRYAPELPRRVVGDAGRIRQILANLISNAVKFTHEGYVLLNVECTGRTNDRMAVRFSVEDTGIGTPADKLQSIFGKFQQADKNVARTYGGSGLGLAISKQLVELMGGAIGVESREGVGSRFYFTLFLPIDQNAPQTKPKAELAGVRVLIVDHSTLNLRVIREQLSAWQMRADTVGSGPDALNTLREALRQDDPYQIVLIDDQLPGQRGDTLGRAIKSEPGISGALLVLLTSMGQRGDAQRMLDLGFSGYLTRPVRQSELQDVLATLWSAHLSGEEHGLVTRYTIAEGKDEAEKGAGAATRLNARVLVVEDNFVNQQVALELLQSLGCMVTMASDGVEAIECLREHTYHVIFMDCQMPRMDGYEATGEIRKLEAPMNRHTPIIAMTAHAMKGDRERCIAAGMDDYVSKPIDPETVLKVLQRWMPAEAGQAVASAPKPGTHDAEELAVLDMKQAMFITGGKMAMFRRIATVYLQHMPNRIHELEVAVGRMDFPEIYRVAHSIQGASASVGGRRLREIAFHLEQKGAREDGVGVDGILEQVKAEFAELKHMLEALEFEQESSDAAEHPEGTPTTSQPG